MTFATPILAAIVAAIAIPALLILYFLKLRRRDVEVSSTLLWKKAIQDLQANAPFQKLRNNILLILQMLALLLALFALAQPEFKNRSTQGRRQIILIDRSASMSADDGGATPTDASATTGTAAATSATSTPTSPTTPGLTRFEAARQQALDLVNALREPSAFSFEDKAEEAMVIAFGATAEVRQTFTSNKAQLRQAIEGITPTDSPSALTQAFDYARAYAGTKKFEDQVVETKDGKPAGFIPLGPGATLHIFSDGRLPDADKLQAAQEDVIVYHAIGSPSAINVGITGLRAERAFDQPSQVNLFVGLQSTDQVARKVDIDISIDNQLQDVKDLTISPAVKPVGADLGVEDASGNAAGPEAKTDLRPGVGGIVLKLDRAQGGVAKVTITPKGSDVLASDNVAYIVIPPAKRLSVALVSEGNFYLLDALKGLKLSRLDSLSPKEFQKILDDGQAGQYDVCVFDRVLPTIKGANGKRTPALPAGGVRSLVLGIVPPPPAGAIDQGESEPDVFVDFVRDHPVLRLASLDKVSIVKARKVSIAPDTAVRTLARTKAGPAILEITDPSSQAIVVCFDPTDSDWPFQAGYVLFLGTSVLYLSETQAGSAGDGVKVGETIQTRLPDGARSASIRTPDNQDTRLEPAPDGTVTFGPVTRTGIYTVSWTGIATARDVADGSIARRSISANLLDPQESDLGTRVQMNLANREAKSVNSDAKATLVRKLWPWLLVVVLGVIMLEWFVYNRKVAI